MRMLRWLSLKVKLLFAVVRLLRCQYKDRTSCRADADPESPGDVVCRHLNLLYTGYDAKLLEDIVEPRGETFVYHVIVQ